MSRIISKVQDQGVNISTNTLQHVLFIRINQMLLAVAPKKAEYWHVAIAVMSCHVVQLQGHTNAVGCRIANHTDMQIIRTAQLLKGSYSIREPSAITLRCERPEYTGCLAKNENWAAEFHWDIITQLCSIYFKLANLETVPDVHCTTQRNHTLINLSTPGPGGNVFVYLTMF